ncbi:hypothetical protein FOL47_004663, partial [Perkinsus chesapeaki]
ILNEDLTSSFHSQIYKTISESAKYRQPKTVRDQDVSITHQPTTHVIRLMPDIQSTSTCSVIDSNNATSDLDHLHGDTWKGKTVGKDHCHPNVNRVVPNTIATSDDIINYEDLSEGAHDSCSFGFARAMLPLAKEIQEEVSSSINEYIEYWYHKQAEYGKEINLSTETTYPDPKTFDLVFITNYSDIGWSIGNKMPS